jgi:hypothetical protein
MQDPVRNRIPSAQEAETLLRDYQKLARRLEQFTIVLDAEERRRVTKFGPGGENVIRVVVDLAEKNGVAIPAVSAENIRAAVALEDRLRPILAVHADVGLRLTSTVLQARHEAWSGTTVLYSLLKRLSRTLPRLEDALRPVRAFFRPRRAVQVEDDVTA